ncbi:MAG: MjaI family restriction endonuclease [Candidatus Methanoperedens sp.]|nr:MjaI family restriction endonuclease [Candidatus Methanoperedens sp.]
MPLADKEFILNYSMNRWQLNFKKNVGATSENIRKCKPNSIEEWKKYYFENVRSRDHITGLGKKLYKEITESVAHEKRFHPDLLNTVNEQDCIDYMFNLVIKRTYDGYRREFG